MSSENFHKYDTIQYKKIIEKLKQEFTDRVGKIMRTKLNSQTLMKVPLLTYSFAVIKCTKTELPNMERKIRVMFPNAAIERQNIP